MKTYELITDDFGSIVKATRGEEVFWIPMDPNNADYQEYLAWLAEGNTPEVIEQ